MSAIRLPEIGYVAAENLREIPQERLVTTMLLYVIPQIDEAKRKMAQGELKGTDFP